MSKLNKLFTEIRQRNLKEDFEIGQAAQAAFEVKRAIKDFETYYEKEFLPRFKKIHNDTREAQDADALAKELKQKQARLAQVIDEMQSYLWDHSSYVDKDSVVRDQHRNRWSRWEHRTPRHIQRAEDEADAM